MKKVNVQKMTTAGLLAAIILLLNATGLGLMPTPWGLKLTTLHVPVIVGAVLGGPWVGAFLGLVFGLTSLISNLPIPIMGDIFGDPLVSILPRMLIGVVAWAVYRFLPFKSSGLKSGFAAAAGTLMNTAGVLGMIFLLHAEGYAQAKGISVEALGTFLLGVIGSNGIFEMILAILLTVAIVSGVKAAFRKRR